MELFENTNTGAIRCHNHMGHEATVKFGAKPTAKSVKTSFGTIRKMTATEVAEWTEMVKGMWATGCEVCK